MSYAALEKRLLKAEALLDEMTSSNLPGQVIDGGNGAVLIDGEPDQPAIIIHFLPEGHFIIGDSVVDEVTAFKHYGLEAPLALRGKPAPRFTAYPVLHSDHPNIHKEVWLGEWSRILFPAPGTKRYLAAPGGRGSGKTSATAIALLLHSRVAHKDARFVCARSTKVSISSSTHPTLKTFIRELDLEREFRILETRILCCHNNAEFSYAGLDVNADSVRSTANLAYLFVEEAEGVSSHALETATPSVRGGPGSVYDPIICFAWNPDRPTSAVDVQFRQSVPPARSSVREVQYYANPHFFENRALADELLDTATRRPERFGHIWLGHLDTRAETLIYRHWSEGTVSYEELTAGGWVGPLIGLDYGRGGKDPSAIVRIWLNKKANRLYVEADNLGHPSIGQQPAFVHSMISPQDPNPRVYADHDPAFTEELNREADGLFVVEPAIKGPDSVAFGIRFLEGLDWTIHPRAKHTLAAVTNYRWKRNRFGEVISPPVAEHSEFSHIADAIRYSVSHHNRDSDVTGGVISLKTARNRRR